MAGPLVLSRGPSDGGEGQLAEARAKNAQGPKGRVQRLGAESAAITAQMPCSPNASRRLPSQAKVQQPLTSLSKVAPRAKCLCFTALPHLLLIFFEFRWRETDMPSEMWERKIGLANKIAHV